MFGWKKAQGAAASSRGGGFLTRLARDTRGNTLAIVGAALVPLAAMIGSGVDMSRAYMAKTRLQNACDAAALAGRRIMQDDAMTDTVRDEARRFFRYNFPQTGTGADAEGPYGTDPVTPDVTRPAAGTVRVTASTRLPTTIMSMFGFEDLPLSVTCDATLNFVNTDIVLVLDVTGSMAWDINGNTSNVPAASQKITALRDAVMAFYDELAPIQTQLAANGLRMRYGVVPYSSTVNVGNLIRAVNTNFLRDSTPYQTRTVNYNTQNSTSTPNGPYWEYYRGSSNPQVTTVATQAASNVTPANCLKFQTNVGFTGFTATSPLSGGGPAPTPTWTIAFPYDGSFTTGGTSGEHGWTGAVDNSGTDRSCRRRRTDTTTTYYYTYTNDGFSQVSVDTSQFKLGTAVQIALDSDSSDNNDDGYGGSTPAPLLNANLVQLAATSGNVSETSVTWNGCIEERRTTSAIGSTATSFDPTAANDLDINGLPTTDENTRWRPQLPRLIWTRSSATSGTEIGSAACPREARRLTTWTRADMLAYVNSLTPTGSTYHDIGMIWGARMISTGGIFADACENFNGMPCTRHVIFMTDGQMDTDRNIYEAYGVESLDQRVSGMSSPSETELNGRHAARFRLMCSATKSMGVSIWVIAFGTSLSSDLSACASNSNQAFTISNRDALIAKFREIGNQIGALRLTQ
jgi:Flp pilus assembly protein TadG